jgi:nucleoside 2-deoxyribosyltransferase
VKKKIYISGPISGVPFEQAKAAFEDAEMRLEEKGYAPVNPIDNGLPRNSIWEEHMRADLKLMMDCDAIYMLKGFRRSRGAMVEYTIAKELGFEIIYQIL